MFKGHIERQSSSKQETRGVKRTVRAAKNREAELRREGVAAAKAGRIAAAQASGFKAPKGKKDKKRTRGGRDGGNSDRLVIVAGCSFPPCC